MEAKVFLCQLCGAGVDGDGCEDIAILGVMDRLAQIASGHDLEVGISGDGI